MKELNNKVKDKIAKLGILKTAEPMKKYTSFKTGGPADLLIWPFDINSLREIVLLSGELSVPVTVLGGCTNLLVSDNGIRGIVIMLNNSGKENGKISVEDSGLIYADSIVKKDRFISYCADENYEGMEFMAGIPGCLGGGIIMNAGITDGNFAGIMDSIMCMDRNGNIFSSEEFKVKAGYRTTGLPEDIIITGAYYKLKKTVSPESVKSKISSLLKERRMKHPLDYPSAGSVFKNPPGHSSWKLVNDSGLKGKSVGGAGVSELHTNFIINKGNATSQDIRSLIEFIKETVHAQFNVSLETEIRFIGEF